MSVYNFGSVNIDYVYRVPHLVNPGETIPSTSLEVILGGKGANQSVALAKANIDVRHVGRLGLGDVWAKERMAEFGVNTDRLECINEASGHAIIQVDEQAENAIVLHGGANQSFDQASLSSLLNDATKGDWLLLQNECNALENAFKIAQQKQLKLAFNPAPMTDSVARLPLQQCDLLILNEVEASALAQSVSSESFAPEKVAAVLTTYYPDSQIILTLGSAGALWCYKDQRINVAAPVVDAVDTTGAGDTFVGYLLAGLIDGLESKEALQRACAAGALSVTKAGATPSIPSSAELKAFTESLINA